MQETFMIEIQTKFYHRRLGVDGFLDTQQVLNGVEVFKKDAMNRLGDNTPGGIRVVGGGGGFLSTLLGRR